MEKSKENQNVENKEEQGEEKQKFTFKDPETPVINISSKKNPKTYKLLCKVILKKFGELELRSLGNAAESVVILADGLVRNGFADFLKIESGMTNLEDVNNEGGIRRGIQFVIKLKKSETFDQLVKEFF